MKSKRAAGIAVVAVLTTGVTVVAAVVWRRIQREQTDLVPIEFVELDDRIVHRPDVPLLGHPTAIGAVGFSGDGTRVASTSRDLVIVWDTETLEKVGEYRGHPGTSRAVVLDREGRQGMALGGEGISLWSIGDEGGIATDTLFPPQGRYRAIAFQSDGTPVVAGSSPTATDWLLVWDLRTDELLGNWRLPGAIRHIEFSPEGTSLVTSSGDGGVFRVGLDGDSITTASTENSNSYVPVGIDPGGSRIVWTAEDSIALIRTISGDHPDRFVPTNTRARSFGLGSDGTLVFAQRDTIRLDFADLTGAPVLLPLGNFAMGVNALGMASDGRHFATGMRDGTLLLWNTATAREMARSGTYTPRPRRAPVEAANECLDRQPIRSATWPPAGEASEFLEPPDLRLAVVLDGDRFLTYCYVFRNPARSAGGATSLRLDISADEGPTPAPLVSTGPADDLGRRIPLPEDPPSVEYGAISPRGWDAFIADGALTWDLADNIGFVDGDSLPPGASVAALGLRSSYLPDVRSVSVDPTSHACCNEPVGEEGEYYASPRSYRVFGFSVGPRHRPGDMTVEILARQTATVCDEPLWIRDTAACGELMALVDQPTADVAVEALTRYRRVLDDLRARGAIHDNAFWMLSVNVAHLSSR